MILRIKIKLWEWGAHLYPQGWRGRNGGLLGFNDQLIKLVSGPPGQ